MIEWVKMNFSRGKKFFPKNSRKKTSQTWVSFGQKMALIFFFKWVAHELFLGKNRKQFGFLLFLKNQFFQTWLREWSLDLSWGKKISTQNVQRKRAFSCVWKANAVFAKRICRILRVYAIFFHPSGSFIFTFNCKICIWQKILLKISHQPAFLWKYRCP